MDHSFTSKLRSSLRTCAAGALIATLSGFAVTAQANETVALKHALYGAGYEIENVKPAMDAATREALEAFQQDHPDLTVTGELDEPTKKALGMVEVDIAAADTAEPNAITSSQRVDDASVEPSAAAAQAKPDVEGGVQEQDDGGWSFF
ncbi:MAG: peptidoglycan-binding domain-containing protein [Marinobacter sp.]|uniref:peptidoglycan-binding domain-containing protein n=1 Tax=Marinobacter sp. TaxID=50741 RepID=UPI00299E6191|nr:peptidoglycan-binding domain-containing protein [Marinobacter sp.]MDX1634751.1 peptidoglycan-binding domain-containing protein [Marinobacter sp.]